MSHTFGPFGFLQFPFHIQSQTSNSNNLYTVDVVDDPNVTSNSGIDSAQLTPSGEPFYTISIRPNDYNQLICSGDFTIDGLSSTWVYNTDYAIPGTNIIAGPDPCYPVDPPWYGISGGQHLQHSTTHDYILKGLGANSCWGPNSGNGSNFVGTAGTYRFNGPFVFDNSTYCDGDFLISNDPVTWRKIILVDIYQLGLGNYLGTNYTPALEPDLEKWIITTPKDFPVNPFGVQLKPIHNGYPAHVRAFVFPEYHPTNVLLPNMAVNIDIDLIAPVSGCNDSNATNYDSAVNRNDGSCTYPPPPEYSITISDGGGTIGGSGPYTDEYTNNTFSGTAPERNLVFNNDGSDIVLANTYAAGTLVNETVSIDLTAQLDQNTDLTVFNFSSGTPAGNIPTTPGFSNRGTDWLDAKNNLTGASIRIVNTGNPSVIRVGSLAGVTQEFSDWHVAPDPTGFQPEKTTVFDVNPGNGTYTAKIVTPLVSGGNIDVLAGTNDQNSSHSGISIVEHYYAIGSPEITAQPALEHFPYKLQLVFEIKDFAMPAEDLQISIGIDHNTENQGDPNWVQPNPTPGCMDPTALNYNPLANIDDGSCVLPIYGCTQHQATNYNPLANVDDGSCTYPTGSKVVCTMMNEFYNTPPVMNNIWLEHSASMKNVETYTKGYHSIFLPLVTFAKKPGKLNYAVRMILEHMAVRRTLDLKAEMNGTSRNTIGRIYRLIFEPLAFLIGWVKLKLK